MNICIILPIKSRTSIIMKKQAIFIILSVAFTAMFIPQNAVAKHKKIMYLGHQYDGKINKENIPSGRGKIKIGELTIRGDFNSNTVNNAIVYKEVVKRVQFRDPVHCVDDYVQVHNREYWGTVTFDNSNNITLKKNGTIKTYVYKEHAGDIPWAAHNWPGYEFINMKGYNQKGYYQLTLDDQLESDLIVNSNNFEPNKVKLKIMFNFIDIIDIIEKTNSDYSYEVKEFKQNILELNPPKNKMSFEFESELQEISLEISKEVRTDYKPRTMKTKITKSGYLIPQPGMITNCKDENGRVWNICNYRSDGTKCQFSVQYPDGSFYEYMGNNTKYKAINHCGIKFYYNTIGENYLKYCVEIDTGIIIGIPYEVGSDLVSTQYHASKFLYLKDSLSLFRVSPYIRCESEIADIGFTKEYDYNKLTSKEIEKIIEEKVIPCLIDQDKLKFIQVFGYQDFDYYFSQKDRYCYLGSYNTGKKKYYTKDEEKAMQAAEESKRAAKREAEKAAEEKRVKAYWTKKFGFNPFGRRTGDLIKPGRSFSLIKEYYNNWYFILKYESNSVKFYHMYSDNELVGYLWVRGGKISSVEWK